MDGLAGRSIKLRPDQFCVRKKKVIIRMNTLIWVRAIDILLRRGILNECVRISFHMTMDALLLQW